MIKVTLPNGVVVEGDSAQEVSNLIDFLHADPAPEPAPVIKLLKDEPQEHGDDYPHRLGGAHRGSIKIGARQEQVLSAAKLLAESAGNRHHEFTSADIVELVGTKQNIVSSALHLLLKVGVVRHGSKRTTWVVTYKGWTARFRIVKPIRAGK